jgi:hypothetical protein
MLHCTMTAVSSMQLGLDDLIADLRHARRNRDLGRMALVTYCDVRRWARYAGEPKLAERAERIFQSAPHPTRDAFLAEVDGVLEDLEQLQLRVR